MQQFKRTEFVLAKYSDNTVERARKNLRLKGFGGQKSNRSKDNTGALSKGLGYTIKSTPTKLVTSFTSKQAYGAVVEEGRRAGSYVPIAPLEAWIVSKKIRVRQTYINSNGQKVSKNVEKDEKSIKSAAISISRSIKKKGIKPVPFMSEAQAMEFKLLPDYLRSAIIDDMENIIVDDFKKDKRFKVTKTK